MTKNRQTITLTQWMTDNGVEGEDELVELAEGWSSEAICPALCDEGCEVECDGTCEHGCESVMLAMGVI